jgi:hypothetical protein
MTTAGTVTTALLLDKTTLKPPVGAGSLMVTVQRSVPAPLIDALLQVKPLSCGIPVPFRATTAVLFVEELLLMVNWPVAAPSAAGSNCTLSVADLPAFTVSGKVPEVRVKPVPVTVAPLMVTGPVPVEFKVTVWVAGVLTATLPKATLVTLTLSVGTGTFCSIAKVSVTVPALAVRVTASAVETTDPVAVNWPVVAFAATITAGGTVTAALLLDKATLKPPVGAGWLMVTVQTSVPAPPIDVLLQEKPLSCGIPVPFSATTAELLVEELLVTVNWPVAAPSAEGSNCTLSVADWPGFTVSGKELAARVKPVPVTVAPLMVTGPVPVEFKVTVCVASEFTATFPKATLVTPMLSVGTGTFSTSAKVSVTVPSVAVRVTDCAVVTTDPVAVNWAEVALAATITAGGVVTAALLLDSPTRKPPVGAGALIVTVQTSVPAPPIEVLLQEKPLSCGTPVPLRATAAVALMEELLLTVNLPVAVPSAEGLNCALSVTDLPGFTESGKVLGGRMNPVPVTVAPLMVTGPVPVEFRVTVCVASLCTATLPKVTLDAPMLSVGTGGFSTSAKLFVTVPAVAVRLTACAVETTDPVAENVPVVAFAATITAGVVGTTALLLARPTLKPPAGAGLLIVTVQTSVPAPPIDVLLQEMPLSCGVAVWASTTPVLQPIRQRPEEIANSNPMEKKLKRISLVRYAQRSPWGGAVTGKTELHNVSTKLVGKDIAMRSISPLSEP